MSTNTEERPRYQLIRKGDVWIVEGRTPDQAKIDARRTDKVLAPLRRMRRAVKRIEAEYPLHLYRLRDIDLWEAQGLMSEQAATLARRQVQFTSWQKRPSTRPFQRQRKLSPGEAGIVRDDLRTWVPALEAVWQKIKDARSPAERERLVYSALGFTFDRDGGSPLAEAVKRALPAKNARACFVKVQAYLLGVHAKRINAALRHL